MTATKDPAFLVVSHLYTESESKIEELSLHTETSAYYKEGKYLQYPLSKYENSAEISFWKNLRKWCSEKDEIFFSLPQIRKSSLLRRDIEANLITIRHYLAMSDIRHKFESYAFPYGTKYRNVTDAFQQINGLVNMGGSLEFDQATMSAVEKKVGEAITELVGCGELLNRMWQFSILMKPLSSGPSWNQLSQTRQPIHLYITRREVEEFTKTTMELARLAQEAYAAGYSNNEEIVNDADMMACSVTEVNMDVISAPLFPKLDTSVFQNAEILSEFLAPDDDMSAVQNDPWSIVHVNPSLPESDGVSSVDSATVSSMFDTYTKTLAIINFHEKYEPSDLEREGYGKIEDLHPLVYMAKETRRWMVDINKTTPSLVTQVNGMFNSIPDTEKRKEEPPKGWLQKFKEDRLKIFQSSGDKKGATGKSSGNRYQEEIDQLTEGLLDQKRKQFVETVGKLQMHHQKKADMFLKNSPPEKSRGVLPTGPDKSFLVDKFIRSARQQRGQAEGNTGARGGDDPSSSSSSSNSDSDQDDDAQSIVSRAVTIRSTESSLDNILSWAENKVKYGSAQMKQKLGRNALNTLKKEMQKACTKTEHFFTSHSNVRLGELHQALQSLVRKIDDKLDDEDDKLLLQKKAPIISIAKWDSNPASYLKWSRNTRKRFENSYTDKEAATASIDQYVTGSERANVQKILYNCNSPEEAFRRLDQHYGNPLICLPRLREELHKLPDTPQDLRIEADNIQAILNYISTAELHGMQDQVSGMFIQEFRNKLSVSRRERLVDDAVLECKEFARRLEKYKISNLAIANTAPRRKIKTFNNPNLRGEGNGGKQPNSTLSCFICSGKHSVYKCALVVETEDPAKIIETLKEKKKCIKCFKPYQHNHKCPPGNDSFLCKTHKQQNRLVCKCYKNKPKIPTAPPSVSDNQATINCVALGKCGFPTEIVTLRNGKKSIQTLLTYDTWSTHCLLHTSGADELGLVPEHLGVMEVSCHTGTVQEESKTVRATIDGQKSKIHLDFLLTDNSQAMPSYTYKIPDRWVEKYGINPNPSSPSGSNRISIGQDAIALFPMEVAVADGVKLYKSRITGKYLLSGKAQESSSDEAQPLFNNRAIVDLQTEISTDAINISPVSKCIKCTSCLECKKPHKPTRERQKAHEELVKSCLSLEDQPDGTQRYIASYPHNNLLQQLPVYDSEVLEVMKRLEARLVKLNLVEKFNEAVADFIRRGVITVTPPDLDGLQKSFVPLCYSLKSDPLATTKLRVCTNGSYKKNPACVSYNDTLLPAPEYLNDITGILTRFRAASSVAVADIATCYHQLKSSSLEKSLRRVYIKPVRGMGSSEPFVEGCMSTVSFGEGLGGPVSQFAIFDTAESCMSAEVSDGLKENSFMDDLQVLSYDKENIDPLVLEVDTALKKRNLAVKKWVKVGSVQNKETKYLNYGWDTMKDCLYLRPRINWSKKRRGAREAPDVQTREQLQTHIKKYPITKRNLASIVMGTLYDPLGLGQPYVNNLKGIFREVCRLEDIGWKDVVPKNIQEKTVEALEYFLTLNRILFPRRAIYLESKIIEFCLFFDGSPTEHCAVSIIVRNIFHNGTEICRLLLAKAKLGGVDVMTAPRAELLACLMSTRLYILIKEYLQTFLALYKGETRFSISGDSTIVLAQIQHPSWKFRMWSSSRIEEIKQNTKEVQNSTLKFYFVKSENNFSDYLTRAYLKEPTVYEEFVNNLSIPERQEVTQTKEKNLHDLDIKNIFVQNNQITSETNETDQNLTTIQNFMMYHRFHNQNLTNEAKKKAEEPNVLKTLLENMSSYFKTRNTVAWLLKWKNNKFDLENAEKIIFKLFQTEAQDYCSKFKGNGFKTIMDNEGIVKVIGRKTYAAPAGVQFKLVPPRSTLYKSITRSYHQKFHRFQSSPVFIRAQMQRDAFYVPSALKRLKSLEDKCALCRKHKKRLTEEAMGTVQQKRLERSAPFLNCQGDLFGPLRCRSFTNQRTIRKIWGLIIICDYSRFLSVIPVESLSTQHLMNSLTHHTLKFGQFQRLEVDFGTNFTGARSDVEDMLEDNAMEQISAQLKYCGAQLIQRAPRAPFLQGSAEHAVKIFKRLIPVKYTMTLAEWFVCFNAAMDLANKRPVGWSSSMESFSPQDMIPVWSNLSPPDSLKGCTEVIREYKKQFHSSWEQFYLNTIIKQNKWFQNSSWSPLQVDDIVLISDLIHNGYMTMARITGTKEDTAGHTRYYKVSYKRDGTKNEKSVTRTARSLVFILRPDDQKADQNVDIISKASVEDVPTPKTKEKLKVRLDNNPEQILDR